MKVLVVSPQGYGNSRRGILYARQGEVISVSEDLGARLMQVGIAAPVAAVAGAAARRWPRRLSDRRR